MAETSDTLMANTKKSDIVAEISESLQSGANFALIKFEKTTHKTLEELRRQLRKNDAKISVIKNTLFEKAINKLSEKEKTFTEIRQKQFPIKDRTALVMFEGEWIEALKTYFNFSKKDEAYGFKFGRIDNNVYNDAQLTQLAQLPAKDQLVARLIGTMKNPIARTTRAMKFNAQKLVYVLSQKAQQG